MSNNRAPQRVGTRFAPETRFELHPVFESNCRELARGAFERLKQQLLRPILARAVDPALRKQMILAGNEAAAMAWTTGYPLLMLPALLEEKAAEVQDHAYHQRQVRLACHALLETKI